MLIQWYPGHMAKAMRMMQENIKLVDAVLYIVDARSPFSCLNPDFDKLIGSKPIFYLLNKSDLADPVVTAQWVSAFRLRGGLCRAISGTDGNLTAIVVQGMREMLKDKIQRDSDKGVIKPMRAMILGIPNCGKSTIMNRIAGQKRALTGDKPGVTKGKQWLRLDVGLELLDTPGTLWGAFADEQMGEHLAYIGSINDDILDISELALNLIAELSRKYPELLKSRYGIELGETPLETYERICKKRGYLVHGGEFDYERGGNAVIDDFRKARIGRITLEKPNEFESI